MVTVSPDANSTMMDPPVWTNVLERLKHMEQMTQMRPVPQFDMQSFGTTMAEGIGRALKGHEKRSWSPDGAPEEPKKVRIEASGEDDNHVVFNWPMRRAYKNPNANPDNYWN